MSLHSFQRVVFQTLARSPRALSSGRLYSRWSHRKPANVILPFEPISTGLKKETIIDLDPEKLLKSEDNAPSPSSGVKPKEPKKQTSSPEQSKEIKEKREKKINNLKQALNQKKVFDDNNEIIYDKCKESDGRISSLLVKLKSKKERMRSGMVLVEGWRLIVDGLEAKCPLKYVIFSQTSDLNRLKPFLPRTGTKILKVPYKEIKLWSDVETPSGIFGIFETPTADNVKRGSRPFPLQIICDNIRVPGNLGAILRAAAGIGCENVLLTKGCVDFWDPKVIRSAAGAHFRLPVHYGLDWEEIHKLVQGNSSIFVADSNTNVGVANVEDDNDVKLEQEVDSWGIPVLPYYSVEYPALQSITLIVGGETEGISENSYRFAIKRNGIRLNIPLQNGVDSLNTGMATAVIAFEIKKQLLQAWTKAKIERQQLHAT